MDCNHHYAAMAAALLAPLHQREQLLLSHALQAASLTQPASLAPPTPCLPSPCSAPSQGHPFCSMAPSSRSLGDSDDDLLDCRAHPGMTSGQYRYPSSITNNYADLEGGSGSDMDFLELSDPLSFFGAAYPPPASSTLSARSGSGGGAGVEDCSGYLYLGGGPPPPPRGASPSLHVSVPPTPRGGSPQPLGSSPASSTRGGSPQPLELKSDKAKLVDIWIESALLISQPPLGRRHFDRETRQNLKKMRPAAAQQVLADVAERSWAGLGDIGKEVHRMVSHAKAQDKYAHTNGSNASSCSNTNVSNSSYMGGHSPPSSSAPERRSSVSPVSVPPYAPYTTTSNGGGGGSRGASFQPSPFAGAGAGGMGGPHGGWMPRMDVMHLQQPFDTFGYGQAGMRQSAWA